LLTVKTAIDMVEEITKQYTNGEVIITWKPGRCMHSANCFHGLPEVFNPEKRPWVNPKAAPTQKIIDQVKKCPSGALSAVLISEVQNK
jgi:uncharacterized Fe-S cluster protein YjdI